MAGREQTSRPLATIVAVLLAGLVLTAAPASARGTLGN